MLANMGEVGHFSVMPFRRLLVDALVLLALDVVLGSVGWWLAPTIFRACVDAMGVDELAMTDPGELFSAYALIAIALAAPAPTTFFVGAAYRFAARRPPPWPALAGACVFLSAAVAGGFAYTVWAVRVASGGPIAPMWSVDGIEPGTCAIQFALRTCIVLIVIAVVVGRRAREHAA